MAQKAIEKAMTGSPEFKGTYNKIASLFSEMMAIASVTKYLAKRSGLPVSLLHKNLFMPSGHN